MPSVTYLAVTHPLLPPEAPQRSGELQERLGGQQQCFGHTATGFASSSPWGGGDRQTGRTWGRNTPTGSFSQEVLRWELKDWDPTQQSDV